MSTSDFALARNGYSRRMLLRRLLLGAGLVSMRGRFNLAPGIGAAGFSEGMVCAVPERPALHTWGAAAQ